MISIFKVSASVRYTILVSCLYREYKKYKQKEFEDFVAIIKSKVVGNTNSSSSANNSSSNSQNQNNNNNAFDVFGNGDDQLDAYMNQPD